MKYSTRVSGAVHIMIALNPTGSLTSTKMAESIQTNPGCIRQLISLTQVQTAHHHKKLFETVSDKATFRHHVA